MAGIPLLLGRAGRYLSGRSAFPGVSGVSGEGGGARPRHMEAIWRSGQHSVLPVHLQPESANTC